MDKTKLISAYIFLLFATALWGGNVIAAKIASIISLEPIKLSFFRNIVVVFVVQFVAPPEKTKWKVQRFEHEHLLHMNLHKTLIYAKTTRSSYTP